jgi:hypothetical protein
MKKMNKLTVAALALAAIGLASTAASAQTFSAGANDLILGFQIASGTGSNTNLEVDLGSILNFTTTTATITLPQLSVSDLTAIYGSGWADTSAGVNWSVAGVGTAADTFDITSPSGGLLKASGSTLAGPAGQIAELAEGLQGVTETTNSTSSTAIGSNSTPASTIATSYTSLEAGNGYGLYPNAETTGASTDELYAEAPGTKVSGKFPSATDLGTFSLSSAGVLTFTGSAAAVPEPSAYALGICAGLLFLVLRRRASVA